MYSNMLRYTNEYFLLVFIFSTVEFLFGSLKKIVVYLIIDIRLPQE